ncbi:kinase-like domain-containing protein [Mycena floridula]|nr:kinase-like domain-containing protein [Mycena floridula]
MFRDLLSRRDDEAKSLLDLLHQLLDLHDPPARVKAEFTTALIQLSESSGCIADCLVLDGLVRSGHAPVAGGSFDDVWKGQLGGQDVAVKVIRVFQDEVNDFLKVSSTAIILWSQLSHPNVLPLYGIYYLDELRARVCLVSPWMACGNLVQFLKNPPAGLDMHTLLLDTASGLEYLHELSIAHGDIKAVNILVTPAWRACITGFEVSSVVNSNILKWSSLGSSPNRGGTARWMAPEVLNGAPTNFARDIYAFACVCYEIFARCLPFRDLSDAAVIKQVLNGVRPDRPDSAKLYDKTWELMQDCWAADPDNRPTASQVVERLSSFPDTTVTRSQTKWDESFPRSLRASLRPQAPLLPVIAELEQLFKPQHMPIVGL